MAKKFDISAFAEKLGPEAVSKLDTGAWEQIEYIDIDQLDENTQNFYSLPGIEELASNIQVCGLQQPLRVRDRRKAGRYIIISGHRRCAALRKLVDAGMDQYRKVPCIREKPLSSAMQELKLIFANSDNRKPTDADLGEQAQRIEMLLYQLKEEGVEFPGRMRDQVAAACQTSSAKLARLKIIREKLTPDYADLFKAERLTEQAAYALARLPEDFQKRLMGALKEPPAGTVAERIYNRYTKDGWRWEPDFSCPDGKPCKRGDTFLRHDMKCSNWEECGGIKCCLKCSHGTTEYGACEHACSRLKTQKKEKRDVQAQAAEERKKKEQAKIQKEVQACAKRLVVAIDAAGLKDSAQLNFRNYGTAHTVERVRAFAAGNFDNVHFYSNELDPAKYENIAALSKLLQCSADYLLGLTDDLGAAAPVPAPAPEVELSPAQSESLEPIPVKEPVEPDLVPADTPESTPYPGQMMLAGWMPGGTIPAHAGRVAALFNLDDKADLICKAMYFSGESFHFSNRNGAICDLTPLAWIALPDDPPRPSDRPEEVPRHD